MSSGRAAQHAFIQKLWKLARGAEPQRLLPLAASFQARQREALPLWTQLGGVVKVRLLVVLVALDPFADPVGGPRSGEALARPF